MSETDDEIQIRESMGKILHAFLDRDIATLNRVLADDFTFTDPSGPVISKQQWLADIANGELIFNSIQPGEVQFRHLGNQAIVTGEATMNAHYTKGDYTGTFKYMGVYARNNGEWRLELTSAERGDCLGGYL